MTKIDVISGFLGAGKTTLIQKLLREALQDTRVVLIENEFGEIGIDGGFLKDSGVELREMNSGCICCSLVGDFGTSLREVLDTYAPERIIIEPSGVGKLSDVIRAIQNVDSKAEVSLGSAIAVVDAAKCKMYSRNFGEFFLNQIEHAGIVILSRTQDVSPAKVQTAVDIIREHNEHAVVITTPWNQLSGQQIISSMEEKKEWEEQMREALEHEAHHHDHEHEHGHEHGHHHEHGEECGCHGHEHEHEHGHEHGHHHEHGEECGCHEHEHEHGHEHEHDHEHEHEHKHEHDHGHEHHHEHGEECTCGCHDHDHHHHHADEVFTSWGRETIRSFTEAELSDILEKLEDEENFGYVLRAKGIVASGEGSWIHFDYVPGEPDIRHGAAGVTGKFCVIGSKLNEDRLAELFGVS